MEKGDLQFNRWSAILAGAFLLAAAGVYLFWPEDLLLRSSFSFFPFVFQHEALFRLPYIFMAISALLAVGMVLGVRDVLKSYRNLLRWVTILAVIALALTAVDFVAQQELVVSRADMYVFAQRSYEGGFGYDLYQTQEGKILITPYPGGPCDRAGILHGDELLQVNGESIAKASRLDIYMKIADTQGELALQVQSPGEMPREVKISRAEIHVWDITTQRAIDAVGVQMLDPTYLFSFGIMGLWLAVVCWRGLAEKAFSRWLVYLGFVVALAYWLFVIGFMFNIFELNYIARIAGFTLGPAWYVWMGLRLGKTNP